MSFLWGDEQAAALVPVGNASSRHKLLFRDILSTQAAFRPGARAAARDVGAAVVPHAGGRPAGVPWRVLARRVPHVGVDRRVPGPPARPCSARWCALGMCRAHQTYQNPWQGYHFRHCHPIRRVPEPPALPCSACWCAPGMYAGHTRPVGAYQTCRGSWQWLVLQALSPHIVTNALLSPSVSVTRWPPCLPASPASLLTALVLLLWRPALLCYLSPHALIRMTCVRQCAHACRLLLEYFGARCADADCAGADFCPWQYPEIHADEASASGVQ